MTHLSTTTCATDLGNAVVNKQLLDQGYTIRHIETWHRDGQDDSIIVWDIPALDEADLPY